MAKRKAFLLRMDPAVYEALQRWADDDLRSLNGQIEYLLRSSLRRAGRTRNDSDGERAESGDERPESGGEGPESGGERPESRADD